MNNRTLNRIVISPIGDLDPLTINYVEKEVRRHFGFDTEIKSLLQDIDFALDPARDQYNSTLILEELSRIASTDTLKILAISDVDLFIPILTHVFGEAQLGGNACIISIFRLQENIAPLPINESFQKRVSKEAIHELGHTFNLRHCPDHFCSMHYCRAIEDVDKKSEQFCRYCKVLLEDEIKKMRE